MYCIIDNYNEKLELVVSGGCINVPPPKDIIIFECPVRESVKKCISILNP